MAPPGYVPPSLVHESIPLRYMHKDPPPPGADTNNRAYVIFFSYLGLCALLTTFIVFRLVRNYIELSESVTRRVPARRHVRTFSILAAVSLCTTWYFMYNYFRISYQTWVMWRTKYAVSEDMMHWGLWLRETSLFREAWEAVIVGHARYWWSHQIFFFACALGLSLEERGVWRGISYTWAFMLLGQIVAISFATNLYLLSLLLSPPPPPPPASLNRRKWLGPWLFNLLAIIFTLGPAYLLAENHYWYHQTQFMPILLTPHIALLTMPIARAILPRKLFTLSQIELAGNAYKFLWATVILGSAIVFARVTFVAYMYSGIDGIWEQLLAHPAVSSVAFDAIFCWVTWCSWWALGTRSVSNATSIREQENWAKEREDTGVVSGRADSVLDGDSGMRRR